VNQAVPLSTSAVFVGRERELAALTDGLDDALDGRGRLFLLSGEPGIGKSRLADELAARARERKARVLWGRCWEAGGAPAYWPWVQALRSYVRDLDAEALISQLGRGAADVAELLPEIEDIARHRPRTVTVDPETARFRLFEAVAEFLRNGGEAAPLLLVLEDLHAADAPSLLLLQFLAGEFTGARLLVVGTYRDVDPRLRDPLSSTLGELVRLPMTQTLALAGLERAEVAAFIEENAGVEPNEGVAAAMHDETDGNPLFLGEVVRLLASEGKLAEVALAPFPRLEIPHGVRSVIDHRLGRLPEKCRDVLALAAVLGREFTLDALSLATELSASEMLELLDEAIAERVLVAGGPGRLRFSHVLIRDVLYDELPQAQRIRLHREMGEALERLYRDPEPHLAELAHHFVSAVAGGEVEKAVDYARRAGERAARLLAYEEAARLFQTALAALELRDPADECARGELLVRLGDAQARAGDGLSASDTFLRAAGAARRVGDPELLAQAALGYGGRFIWARAGTDPHLVSLLEEALGGLGPRDSTLRVRVMARLAGALRDQHDPQPRDVLSREALEMAQRLNDAAAIATALDGRTAAIMWPDNSEERLALARELALAAAQAGDVERAAHALYTRTFASLELPDMVTVRSSLEEYATIAVQLKQPAWRWLLVVTRATLALFEGRLDEGEALIDEALALGSRAQASDAILSHRVQVFTLHLLRGQLDELEEALRRSMTEYPARPMFRCMLTYLLTASGRDAEARILFDELAENRFAALPITNEWLVSLTFLADAAHRLDEREHAGVLYELLLPHATRNACTADYIAIGSVSRPLGVAAAIMARWEDAERHFEEALRSNLKMGARPWAAWSALDWAEMLLRRDRSSDRDRAADLLATAIETASQLRMAPLLERAAALGERRAGELTLESRTSAPARSVFRREGEYWSIAYSQDAFRVKDSKGLRYLARLLGEPGREFHALDLVAGERRHGGAAWAAEPGLAPSREDGAEILDSQAKAEYRRRLDELDDELEEARSFGDLERAARAEAEREFVVRELASAIGLGGRDRRTGSPSERARVSVTRAIRSALARIRECSPPLGEHLERTIRTGTYCSYTPDPRAPIDWQT
jgi:tetratricopeptide (TPR) repeat protein